MSTWRTGMTFDTFDTCEDTSEERMASLMSSPSAVMLGWSGSTPMSKWSPGEEFGDCFGDLLLIHLIAVEVDALMQAPPGACAVHGAGIEVGEAEMAGQRLRSGGLSDARRAVDGDSYHSPTSFCRERTSTWDSTR